MRKIKFRAWHYGQYRYCWDGWSEDVDILSDAWAAMKEFGAVVEQYTGLTDKNGKEIYEGDIVRVGMGVEGYQDGVITWEQKDIRFVVCFDDGKWGLVGPNDLEVIGNIHENPELLEAKE